jgi:hypothetical protein
MIIEQSGLNTIVVKAETTAESMILGQLLQASKDCRDEIILSEAE